MQTLFTFLSYHESQEETVLLIHGAFSSYHAFDATIPHLSRFHLLIPQYTAATRDPGFSLEDLLENLAQLVREHAKGSRARLVGHSFGGHLALRVAGLFPEQTSSVFASGVNRIPSPPSTAAGWGGWGGWFWVHLFPFLVWGSAAISRVVPRKAIATMERHPPVVERSQLPTLQEVRNILHTISAEHRFPAVQTIRVCLLASLKGDGLFDDPDSVQDARSVFAEVQPSPAEGSRCVGHRGLTHSWVEVHPDLFAKTVIAVIEGEPVDDSFVNILVNDQEGR
ncbi:hypothetical protein DL767_003876 [Monosporascus sp. MG133]|nr:hypothetical protein DL767_003876 [Monosporascus sp. MG133]